MVPVLVNHVVTFPLEAHQGQTADMDPLDRITKGGRLTQYRTIGQVMPVTGELMNMVAAVGLEEDGIISVAATTTAEVEVAKEAEVPVVATKAEEEGTLMTTEGAEKVEMSKVGEEMFFLLFRSEPLHGRYNYLALKNKKSSNFISYH